MNYNFFKVENKLRDILEEYHDDGQFQMNFLPIPPLRETDKRWIVSCPLGDCPAKLTVTFTDQRTRTEAFTKHLKLKHKKLSYNSESIDLNEDSYVKNVFSSIFNLLSYDFSRTKQSLQSILSLKKKELQQVFSKFLTFRCEINLVFC